MFTLTSLPNASQWASSRLTTSGTSLAVARSAGSFHRQWLGQLAVVVAVTAMLFTTFMPPVKANLASTRTISPNGQIDLEEASLACQQVLLRLLEQVGVVAPSVGHTDLLERLAPEQSSVCPGSV
ncbi:unnamed protein product [Protopolystoma xenopodis]|uniref:Uncharacterized protein n=1 Tax=Protopolystoma xenopodis TaxID=117903 RepID=A0A3S5AKM1_9PLAT|nr:unnamed protein product [Protopolystoma xenopodis]